jgi:DNA-binding XRE family transcriptional regulator
MKQAERKPKERIHGNRIREILAEIEMTQRELADLALDGNYGFLSRIMSGKRRCISLPIAFKIANVLNRSVDEVFIANKTQTIQEDEND